MALRTVFLAIVVLLLGACDSGGSDGTGGSTPGNQSKASGDFDSLAKGTWAGQDCAQEQNVSYIYILSIKGNGQGSLDFNLYSQSLNCTGQPEFRQGNTFTYTVNKMSGGEAELTIDGDIVKVSINGKTMVVSEADGSRGTFQKVQ